MLPVSAWMLRPLVAQQAKAPMDVLRVRQLVIVDANGTDRIVIAAPVPDPKVRGKRSKRRSPGTGIMFNDANGDERLGSTQLGKSREEAVDDRHNSVVRSAPPGTVDDKPMERHFCRGSTGLLRAPT